MVEAIAEGRRHRAEGRRQKLRKSRVSTIKNVLITLAVAIGTEINSPVWGDSIYTRGSTAFGLRSSDKL